jgi:hypothetical protein
MPGLKVEKMVNGALNEKDGMIDYERELLRQWNNTTNPLSDPTKLFQSVMKKFADKTQSTYQVTFDSGKKVEYDPGTDKFNVTLKADQDKVSDQKFCMVFPAEIPTDLTYISNVISNVGGAPSSLNQEYMLGVTFLRKCR